MKNCDWFENRLSFEGNVTTLLSRSGGRLSPRPYSWRHLPLRDRRANETDSSAIETAGDDEDPGLRRRRAEAVLLFHRGAVHLRKLAALAGLADATEARTRIRELNEIYDEAGSGLRIEEVAGGYQMLTRPSLAPWLRRLSHLPPAVQLGAAAMETLAVIAYRQPVLRADVEAIRGVACGELIRQLMQKDLVRICGRSEELGRPYLYGTTPYFLQVFGLKNANALPAVPGAGIAEESEDTLDNSATLSQASQSPLPIEPSKNADSANLSPSTPFDADTLKESDVSIAPGPVAFDEAEDLLTPDSPRPVAGAADELPYVAAVDDDDDDEFFDDDDDEEDDDDWDDDEDVDDDVDDDEEDEELADEWEEVGDDDEAELDDEDDEEDDLDELDDEEEDDLEEELVDDDDDDDWDDDDEDWNDEDDDDEEEWD